MGRPVAPQHPWPPAAVAEAPCLFKEWFRLSGPSADLAARKYLSLSSPTEPRASLNTLSLPLRDYQGFINEQGVLFHTSYQTDHKTPSLGFDCLVTHVGAAPYGNAASSLGVCTRERKREDVCDVVFFSFFESVIWLIWSEQLDLPSHQHTTNPGRRDAS